MTFRNLGDYLRLELEDGSPPANLHPNPSGRLGAWGYLTPTDSGFIITQSGDSDVSFNPFYGAAGPQFFDTTFLPVTAGQYVGAGLTMLASTSSSYLSWRIDWYDAAKALLGSSAPSARGAANGGGRRTYPGQQAPAGAEWCKVRVTFSTSTGANLPAGHLNRFKEFTVTPAAAPFAAVPYVAPVVYVDVLDDVADLLVGPREALNVGVLKAVIKSAALDPAAADSLVKPNRHVRITYLDAGSWHELYSGKVLTGRATYDAAEADADRRTRIELEAVDPATVLANTKTPLGVATIPELAAVLEDVDAPWAINGSSDHLDPVNDPVPVYVTRNDNATALDQVAIVRDTQLGHAWVDPRGVLQVWDAAERSSAVAAVLDETAYSDVRIDYDSDRCINEVTLKVLREDEEVTFGPYVDKPSIRAHGRHALEVTVAGIDDEAGAAAYAAAVFAANAVPAVRITGATLPIRGPDDLSRVAGAKRAALDIGDLVTVSNDNAGITEDVRIAGLTHHITARKGNRSNWTLELDLVGDERIAPPQQVPSPTPTTGKTLAQLLRPVGEVTVMHGLPSQVWPGWLVLNGAALTPGEYPELEEWLTTAGLPSNVLPDYTDRIVVGAGVKALGAKTGTWAKTILAAMLPAHRHGLPRSAGTGSGSSIPRGGAADGTTTNSDNSTAATQDLDVTPPVIGAYYVIRARSGV